MPPSTRSDAPAASVNDAIGHITIPFWITNAGPGPPSSCWVSVLYVCVPVIAIPLPNVIAQVSATTENDVHPSIIRASTASIGGLASTGDDVVPDRNEHPAASSKNAA